MPFWGKIQWRWNRVLLSSRHESAKSTVYIVRLFFSLQIPHSHLSFHVHQPWCSHPYHTLSSSGLAISWTIRTYISLHPRLSAYHLASSNKPSSLQELAFSPISKALQFHNRMTTFVWTSTTLTLPSHVSFLFGLIIALPVSAVLPWFQSSPTSVYTPPESREPCPCLRSNFPLLSLFFSQTLQSSLHVFVSGRAQYLVDFMARMMIRCSIVIVSEHSCF